jgi:alpha-galactosidase
MSDGLIANLGRRRPTPTQRAATTTPSSQHRQTHVTHPTMMNLRMQFKRIQIQAATMGIHHNQKPLAAMMMTCSVPPQAEAIEQQHRSRMKVQQCPCQRFDAHVPIIDVLPTLTPDWGFAIHLK